MRKSLPIVITLAAMLVGCGISDEPTKKLAEECEAAKGNLTMSVTMGHFPSLTTTCDFGDDWSVSK